VPPSGHGFDEKASDTIRRIEIEKAYDILGRVVPAEDHHRSDIFAIATDRGSQSLRDRFIEATR